jgi:hypothetical protein
MDIPALLELAGALGIAVLLYNFRAACTDFVYLFFRYWKHSLFILICLLTGTLAGLEAGSINQALNSVTDYVTTWEDPSGETAIDQCKDFITAKMEGRKDYREPAPPFGDVIRLGARSYWDICAQTLGMNYWRHDIAINGRRGGAAFCDAYRRDNYRSPLVDGWCTAVLSPGRKI